MYVFVLRSSTKQQTTLVWLAFARVGPQRRPRSSGSQHRTRPHELNQPHHRYDRVSGVEGYCASNATLGKSTGQVQPLVLWRKTVSRASDDQDDQDDQDDFRTCGGSDACNDAVMRTAGYVPVAVNGTMGDGVLCYGYSGNQPEDLPCRVALPSIARDDGAFWDQLCVRAACVRACVRACVLSLIHI